MTGESPPAAKGVTAREAVIVAAMKQSFRDVVAGSSGKLFEDTGVTMPADHVWERYAKAALEALSTPAAPELGAVKVKPLDETQRQGWRDDKGRFCIPLSDGLSQDRE